MSRKILLKHRDECPQICIFPKVNPQPSLTPFHGFLNFPRQSYLTSFPWPTDEPCYTCSERLENKSELNLENSAQLEYNVWLMLM